MRFISLSSAISVFLDSKGFCSLALNTAPPLGLRIRRGSKYLECEEKLVVKIVEIVKVVNHKRRQEPEPQQNPVISHQWTVNSKNPSLRSQSHRSTEPQNFRNQNLRTSEPQQQQPDERRLSTQKSRESGKDYPQTEITANTAQRSPNQNKWYPQIHPVK
jgi:hypothetical protein